ncbi:hypothetical protein BOSEA31B_12915 [Hyphomicrobiales bacterium]|nr:hypothetical protein BOSEA31B_12915 [Hyphomicrobiales bacterium]
MRQDKETDHSRASEKGGNAPDAFKGLTGRDRKRFGLMGTDNEA